MAKSVQSVTCFKCREQYRSKLVRGAPTKLCPTCGNKNVGMVQPVVVAQ